MATIKAELIALADYALVDEDKKISVIGVFNSLNTEGLPVGHPRMSFVVTLLGKKETDVKVDLKILSPSGKVLINKTLIAKFGASGRYNLINNFVNFVFSEEGEYEFLYEYNGNKIASYKLEVILQK